MSNALTLDIAPGTPFIDGERWFDAPVDLVWRAYTEPDLVARWLGPDRYEMDLETYDCRTGGSWAYTHRGPEGSYSFRGVFHSVEPQRRIVQTFEFLGFPGAVNLESADFEEVGGRTRVTMHSVCPSVEARDGMVAAGMEGGMSEGFAKLEAVLAELA